MFSETGGDADKITTDEKAILNAAYADNSYLKDTHSFKFNAALLLQIDNITRELDHLRDKILANENCCAANTGKTTISAAQANAITLNTAKQSLTDLMSGTQTTLSFGDMITTPPPKGSKTSTYSIVMTAVSGVGNKAITKSVTLQLI